MVQGKIVSTLKADENNNNSEIISEGGIVTSVDDVEIIAKKTIEKDDKVLNILGLSIPQLFVLNSLNITKSSTSISSLNKEFIHEPLQLFSLGSINITKSSIASSLNKKLNGEPQQLFSLAYLIIKKKSSA